MKRRDALEALAKAGAGVMLTPLLASASASANGAHSARATPVLVQELPAVSVSGWKMTAVEVTYAPGQVDRAHKHPGFVFGYVLEGELRFKVDGGEETVHRAGEMFYEAPGSVHRVSANASATAPCRFLAMVFADKSKPLTEDV